MFDLTDKPSSKAQTADRIQKEPQQNLPSSSPSNQNQKLSKRKTPSMGHGRMIGRKRKAGPPPDPPSARRLRHDPRPVRNLKDEAYVREHFNIPSEADYPTLSPQLFRNLRHQINTATQKFAKIYTTFRPIHHSAFHCDLEFRFKDGSEVVKGIEGEGKTKDAAKHAATWRLLAYFHEKGMMKELFESERDYRLDKNTLATEADAKMDIYNYAARFGCVPSIRTEKVSSKRRAIGKNRSIVMVTVTLPEQSISVSAKGLDLKSAEIAAALEFKKAAGKYHAQNGSESIVIKDSGALTTDNARQFFDYYKIIHPGDRVEITTRPGQIDRNMTEAQLVRGGKPIGPPVQMSTKKRAEDLAYLVAAIEIKKKEPAIYPKFLKAFKTGNGQILAPMPRATMSVERDCLLAMQDTLLQARDAGLPDEVRHLHSDEDYENSRSGGFGRRPLTPTEMEMKDQTLQQRLMKYLENPKLAELRKRRTELPMNQYLSQVVQQVEEHTYSIIIGATGSGKTTQVPQILLERAIAGGQGSKCNIICTQPRRIAATSVARRVAEERDEILRDTVGYHVRFDSKLPEYGGSVTYCTTGILLQQLQNAPDEVMDRISHLVIDEVHERDILIDFLMIILKKVMAQRIANGKSVPKVVLMSATMNSDLFASYFGKTSDDGETIPCPTLSVPGRTFPVKERFLEDIMNELTTTHSAATLAYLKHDRDTLKYTQAEESFANANSGSVRRNSSDMAQPDDFVIDWKHERKVMSSGSTSIVNEKEEALVPHALVAATIAHIVRTTSEGAILVFLPGLDEIVKVNELLTRSPVLGVNFGDVSKYSFFLLHSSMPAGQKEVFEAPAPGVRKIILATNIAETSITIPDVQHVLDSGKLREKRYDQARRITQLQCTWLSKSNSKQRAGRAGRVQNGNYYALFSQARYQSLRAVGLPEMLRTDLQEICLDIKAQAFKAPVREFLAAAIEPPPPEAVDTSMDHLVNLDAFTEDEKLTPLGRLLAALPVHPSLGKMIVLGVLFRCLDPMIILGAAAAERSLFVAPLEAKREARQAKLAFVRGSGSDHLALLNAVRQLRVIKAEHGDIDLKNFCHHNFIHLGSFKTLESTGKQIEGILVESGIIPRVSQFDRQKYQFGSKILNENSDSVPLIKALLLAGTHPNLAASTGSKTFRTVGEQNVVMHPASVNADREKGYGGRANLNANHFIYSMLARTNDGHSMMLRDSTEVTPLMAALFGGNLALDRNILEIDDWLPLYVRSTDRRAARIVIEFRKALERLYAEAYTDLTIERRARDDWNKDARTYLTDQKVPSIFASGLVDIFRKDITLDESVGSNGYGADRWRT